MFMSVLLCVIMRVKDYVLIKPGLLFMQLAVPTLPVVPAAHLGAVLGGAKCDEVVTCDAGYSLPT